VHVDVKQADRIEVTNLESRLFGRLAQARVFGRLPGIDVPTGLNPNPETLVQVQNDAARRENERSHRHVMLVRLFVEGVSGPGETIQSFLN
jgi:hypothetical protein